MRGVSSAKKKSVARNVLVDLYSTASLAIIKQFWGLEKNSNGLGYE